MIKKISLVISLSLFANFLYAEENQITDINGNPVDINQICISNAKDHPKKDEINILKIEAMLSLQSTFKALANQEIDYKEGVKKFRKSIKLFNEILSYAPDENCALNEIIATYSDILQISDKKDYLNILLEQESYITKLLEVMDKKSNTYSTAIQMAVSSSINI